MNLSRKLLIILSFLTSVPLLLAMDKENRMSLQECIDYAYFHSPTLKKEALNNENALLNEVIAKAKLAFKFDYSANYSLKAEDQNNGVSLQKQFIDGTTITLSGDADRNWDSENEDLSVSAKISKQIIGGGGWLETSNSIDDAFIDKTIALNNLHKERRSLAFQIKRSFYRVIRDYQSLSIQERRLVRAKKNLEHAIERERPQDIITAKIEVPENELALIRSRSGIEQRLDSLKNLIGMPIEEQLLIDTTFEYKIFNTDLDRDKEFSFQQQEDFLNNQLELKKLKADEIVFRQKLWPSVSISATHTDQNLNDGFDLGGEDEQVISLDLSWSIGREKDLATFKRQLNEVRKKELDLFILKQEKTRKLFDLHRRLLETEQSIDLQEQRVEFTEKQVALFQDRWSNGEIDILELVRSQNSLEDAKVNLINLKASYLELVAEYKFEVGRG